MLSSYIPESKVYKRTRKTNFSDNYTSCSLKVFRKEFCEKLIEFGYPTKNKTSLANTPQGAFDEKSFWRGVIDGDGSLGLRKSQGRKGKSPYLSLVTSSELLKTEMCNLLNRVTGRSYFPQRNTRDNVYNITCAGSSAYKMSSFLYEDASISMPRKFSKYLEIKSFMEGK